MVSAKILATIAGVLVVPSAGYFLYSQYYSSPRHTTLIRVPEYNTGDKKDKFGGKLAAYFISTTSEDNDEFWRKRLEKMKTDTPDTGGFFKDVKDGNLTVEKLKEVCSSKYDSDFPTDNNEKTKWDEVWKYCSISAFQKRPSAIEESNKKTESPEKEYVGTTKDGDKKIGEESKDKLISTEDTSEVNRGFWFLRNLEFKLKKLVLTEGNKYDTEKDKYKFFYDDSRKDKELREICKEAYSQKASTATSTEAPTKDEVSKFCSIEMIKPTEETT